MKRHAAALFASLFLLVAAVPALATIRSTGIKIRWAGDIPAPAKAGEELRGRFEIEAGTAGVVENLRIEGLGWTASAFRAPAATMLARGDRRTFEFAATPRQEREPLVVSCTFNGKRVVERFRLDAASLAKVGRRTPVAFVDGPPRLSGIKGTRTAAQTIRFKGRFVHPRPNPPGPDITLGADHLVVRIMDDDSPDPFDEAIWEGFTDENGEFDVTVGWDDGGDDPDIYVVFSAGGPEVDVQTDDILETTYEWSTEDDPIDDFEGNFVDWGTMQSGDPGEHGAVFVYTNVTRAYRHTALHAMTPPLVDVQWPDDDGSFYNRTFEEIHLDAEDTWIEGTQTHEFGHHLHYIYGDLPDSDYDNGYCDGDPGTTSDDGHCIYCPENHQNAFSEGFANWLASIVNRTSIARYNLMPLSLDDLRYDLEQPQRCQQAPNDTFPDARTEGFVAALMRDIDDAENDDHDLDGTEDCIMDATSLGDSGILTVFRDDDPIDVFTFVDAFRDRYQEEDQDLWSTLRNVAHQFGEDFLPPTPVITRQPVSCIVARSGDEIRIGVKGRGQLLNYQWRKNGVPLFDDGVVTGTDDSTLVMNPAGDWMNGTFTCLVSTCNDTFSTLSLPCRVTVLSAPNPRALVSWGNNLAAQMGTGATSNTPEPPTVLPDYNDFVRVVGGAAFTAGLHADGTVHTWGHADYGELGNGAYSDNQHSPVPVPGLNNVLQIAAGVNHTLVLKRDGTVWGWGWNGYGQLGDSTQASQPSPVRAREIGAGCVKAIATSAYHSLVLMTDGTVLAWGNNDAGQLGRGTVGGWSLDPQPVQGLTNVEAIVASSQWNLALKTDGTVWAWGRNQSGCLGTGVDQFVLPHSATPVQVQGLGVIRKIAAAVQTGFAITNEGAAYGWGDNQYGIIGHGNQFSTQELTPVLIPGLVLPGQIVTGAGPWAAAVVSTGKVYVWGYNYYEIAGRELPSQYMWSPVEVEGVHSVAAIGAGWATVHACGSLTGVTDVFDAARPAVLALRASPNPSMSVTRVAFDLPEAARVSLAVFDVSGRRIRSLLEGERPAGRYDVTWDGRSASGGASLAGVYFVRLEAGGRSLTERVVRMR